VSGFFHRRNVCGDCVFDATCVSARKNNHQWETHCAYVLNNHPITKAKAVARQV